MIEGPRNEATGSSRSSADYQALLGKALKEIRSLRAELERHERRIHEPIAIVGLGCRFPGGGDGADQLWKLLVDGTDAIVEIPPDRWDAAAFYDPDLSTPGKMNSRWGGFLTGLELFDAAFFGISPREAACMDPRQRLLLEVAWESLESAGLLHPRIAGTRAGVFVGIYNTDYAWLGFEDLGSLDAYSTSGNALSVASGRLSYLLDLRGPSLSIDTACSSSLLATHLACESLRSGECDMALAGGVNVMLAPGISVAIAKFGMLAKDGRCKAFDARADGFVRSEGCGMVVLKRLADALADGDPIVAVIRGSAANQDGRSNGLTAPSMLSQQEVIRRALECSGVQPAEVGYIEAHGTGTSLGDPIEIEALASIYGAPGRSGQPCVVGAVKTNIGHLEASAGVAGLIKASLCLQKKAFVPNLHFQELNPNIVLDGTRLTLAAANEPWEAAEGPRRAGVSSFGLSGTNVHIVLEEAPPAAGSALPRGSEILLLSGRSADALAANARRHRSWLAGCGDELMLPDACFTSALKRSHHEHRLAVIGEAAPMLAEALDAFDRGEIRPEVRAHHEVQESRRRIVFVFPGQGSQWKGQGLELLETEPVFRDVITRCAEALRPWAEWSLLDVLEGRGQESALDQVDVIQPTLFALQVALAELWRSWGVEPETLIGQSMGEVAAACVAGALDLSDGARIICRRSQIAKRTAGQGAMAVVGLPYEDAVAELAGVEDRLSVAVSSSPSSVVLSGEPGALEGVLERLRQRNVFCRQVKVDYASHSPQMEPLRELLLEALEGIEARSSKVPVYSTVLDRLVEGAELDAAYWVENLRCPVLFWNAARSLMEEGHDTFIEISPHPVVLQAIEQGARYLERDVALLGSLQREVERQSMLESLGELYALGHPIDWSRFYPDGGRVLPLPTYEWQRRSFWFEGARKVAAPAGRRSGTAAGADDLYSTIQWHMRALGEGVAGSTGSHDTGTWILLEGSERQGAALAEELEELGHRVIRVAPGDRFEQVGEDRYLIEPLEARHYERLIELCVEEGASLRGAAHLWALRVADDAGELVMPEALERATELALSSVVLLAQAMSASISGSLAGSCRGARLWLVSRGVQPVGREPDVASLLQAPIWGLGRVIALERSELWGGLVDLDPGASEPRSAASLVAEMMALDVEDQVVLRGGQRWVPRLVRYCPETASDAGLEISAEASYLITGGLGGAGLQLARWLVDRGARTIVLTSRSGLPERHQWAEVEGPRRRVVDIIESLEQLSAEVRVVRADVADRPAMQALLDELAVSPKPLAGIIHAAGVQQVRKLEEIRVKEIEQVMRPKIQGAWILHELTQGQDLDFFLLCSSAASVFGSMGLAPYAAANHCLDTLAQLRRAQGQAALSVSWGLLEGGGMVTTRDDAFLGNVGVSEMPAHEWIGAFERLQGGAPPPHVTVARADWRRLDPLLRAGGPRRPFLAELVGEPGAEGDGDAAPRPRIRRELEQTPPARRRRRLIEYVQQCAASVMRLPPEDELPVDRGLFQMGMDSLMMVELRNRLQGDLGVELASTLAFDCGTVRGIADHLASEVLDLEAAPGGGRTAGPDRAGRSATDERAIVGLGGDEPDPIVIVGIGCRLPGGVGDPDSFWEMLEAGADGIVEIPGDRWDVDALYDADPEALGKMYTRWGGFIDGVDQFDARVFGISPREAAHMDPQHRLALEVTWEALERAGIAPTSLAGSRTGVFLGLTTADYFNLQVKQVDPEWIGPHSGTGNASSFAPGRISHVLGLCGPSVAVDTACSSSLVAVHLACDSLLKGESDLAVAGGVSLILSPEIMISLCRARMLSPSGRCKTFDEDADGYVRGEGCGVVLLKRLSTARADQDRVLAVIRGSAVNHDGASAGPTVPSALAHERVVRDALRRAGLEPGDVLYLETHGTGTKLGDPIEIQALRSVFGGERPHPLRIGSVKTNIGHLEGSAGVAGLIKTVLALEHGVVPPHLNFQKLNPHIELGTLDAEIPTTSVAWPEGVARIAGVSSLGVAGTNAHVILESAPALDEAHPEAACRRKSRHEPEAPVDRPEHLLCLSAASRDALTAQATRYADWLDRHPETSLADAAWSAHVGRAHLECRLALTAPAAQEASTRLRRFVEGDSPQGLIAGRVVRSQAPQIVFMFTGQGSQYVGMGRALYQTSPVFHEAFDACDRLLGPHLEMPLSQVLYPDEGSESPIDQTAYTQPALFALEYALARLLRSWGIAPSFVIGHSVGEIVACCDCGVLRLEDGAALIAARGSLMQSLPSGGAMAAVFAPEERVLEAIAGLDDQVALAAVNGPTSMVISGEGEAVSRLCAELGEQGIRSRPLTVSHAFHSPLMEPILDQLEAAAAGIKCSGSAAGVVSNLSGGLIDAEELASPGYWRRHAREPVRFWDGLQWLLGQGELIFVEIGPSPALSGAARRALSDGEERFIPTLRKDRDDWRQVLGSLGRLYVAGCEVDLGGLDLPYQRSRVELPTYAFTRRRCWVDLRPLDAADVARAARGSGSASAGAPGPEQIFYEQRWQIEPLAQRSSTEGGDGPGSWIVLADRSGMSRSVVDGLREQGAEVLEVVPNGHDGDVGPEGEGPGVVAIDPSQIDGYRGVLERLGPDGRARLRGVVHLWSIEAAAALGEAPTAGGLEQAQTLACTSVLLLARALLAGGDVPPRLWIVTSGLAAVHGTLSAGAVAQAPVWGLVRGLALEHPELWGGLIDIAESEAAGDGAVLVDELLRGDGSQVVLTDGERLVARLVPAEVEDSVEARIAAIDSEASYLVTGGLGGIGLHVLRFLVDQGARSIVVTSRAGLPARSGWTGLDPDTPHGAKARAIAALEERGATISVVRADAADDEAMGALFAELCAEGRPRLKGIFHAAGVMDPRRVIELEPEELARVMRPKLAGGWILHRLSERLELDSFVLFSSIASTLGSFRQAHYAAANHSLDTLAEYRQARGLPAVSIGWGPWSAAGGGMLTAENEDLVERTGLIPFEADEGLAAMARAMSAGRARLVVARVDWHSLRSVYDQAARHRLLDELKLEAPDVIEEEPDLRRRLAAARPRDRLSLLTGAVTSEVLRVLDVDEAEAITDESGFSDLGMDSLMAVELRNSLQQKLGIELPASMAFNYPTISSMTGFVAERLPELQTPSETSGSPASPDELETLSEAEMIAMLESKLREIEEVPE